MWNTLCELFSCSCMYTKTVRNRLQPFKETTWVVKLLCCRCSCNFSDMETYLLQMNILAFSAFPGEFSFGKTSGPTKKVEKIFYSACCIMGSGVGILARKTRLAMIVDGIMNYTLSFISYSFDQVVFIVWIKSFSSKKHFLFLSVLVRCL